MAAESTASTHSSNGSSIHAVRAARLIERSSLAMARFLERQIIREFLAEFIGTFILIAVGDAAIASYVLKNSPQGVDTFAVCFCWGVGAMIGITATAAISGGHINPAVTVAQAVLKNHPWSKVWHYLAGQYLGAFAASAVVFITYHEAFEAFDGGNRSAYGSSVSTGQIFATYPSVFLTIAGSFADQIIGTALLMFAVLAVSDDKGLKIPTWLQPLVMCFVITTLCIAYGLNCMAVLNPARDLSPRLFTTISGWGWSSFQPLGGHYWWVAGILGPHLGAILGGWVYLLSIDHSSLGLKPSSSHDVSLDKNELRAVAGDGTDKEHEHLSSVKEVV